MSANYTSVNRIIHNFLYFFWNIHIKVWYRVFHNSQFIYHTNCKQSNLPTHIFSFGSTMNPGLQRHTKEPRVFSHWELMAQLWICSMHSSMSVGWKTNEYRNKNAKIKNCKTVKTFTSFILGKSKQTSIQTYKQNKAIAVMGLAHLVIFKSQRDIYLKV